MVKDGQKCLKIPKKFQNYVHFLSSFQYKIKNFFQMNKKVSELDATKSRLRLLEQNIDHHKSEQDQPSNLASNSVHSKSENHRVHFDLNNATEIRKPARSSRPNGAQTRPNSAVHLPSDARQKLEQLVISFKHANSLTEDFCYMTKIYTDYSKTYLHLFRDHSSTIRRLIFD